TTITIKPARLHPTLPTPTFSLRALRLPFTSPGQKSHPLVLPMLRHLSSSSILQETILPAWTRPRTHRPPLPPNPLLPTRNAHSSINNHPARTAPKSSPPRSTTLPSRRKTPPAEAPLANPSHTQTRRLPRRDPLPALHRIVPCLRLRCSSVVITSSSRRHLSHSINPMFRRARPTGPLQTISTDKGGNI
ncbi:hypothetical protein E4U43_006269, partial [Claviceps pusilla]